jgi:hypothetical protein
MKGDMTPLESAVIQLVADRNWPGFNLGLLRVTKRECTGVGRYTHFAGLDGQRLTDGSYGADAHFIEMECVPSGLFFTVEVVHGSVSYLEIVSSGADSWDGVERPWRIA